MNTLTISGLALALLIGGASAQAIAPAPVGMPAAPAGMQAPPPLATAPDAMDPGAGAPPPPLPRGVRVPPPRGPAAKDDDGPGGPPDGPRGRRPPPPKAAHFRVEHGDTAVDIKCADDEPMKACADLTLQLLDKLQAAPGAATPAASVPKP